MGIVVLSHEIPGFGGGGVGDRRWQSHQVGQGSSFGQEVDVPGDGILIYGGGW